MKKGLIITLPASDIVTNYLSISSKEILSVSEAKGINVKKLENEESNKEEFEKAIKKLNYQLIVFNGHGNTDYITGHKENIIIQKGQNHTLLSNRITYARSCYAAQGIGIECTKEDSKGCFIGYNLPFMFLNEIYWEGNPCKDKTAKLFLEKTSNLVPIGLLKSHTASESNDRCKISMLKIIKKALLKGDNDSQIIAETMWNNYQGQVIIGNKNAKMID